MMIKILDLSSDTGSVFTVAVDDTEFAHWFQPVLGNLVRRPAKLDRTLARELQSLAEPDDPYETLTGRTMCTCDFYEGN
jgi:uridine phosphorylase